MAIHRSCTRRAKHRESTKARYLACRAIAPATGLLLVACGGSASGSTAHAEVSRCYIGDNRRPEAEVTLEGGDPTDPFYSAEVGFITIEEPDIPVLFSVELTAESSTATE
ncbi:MAG: hypothetical protein JSS68_13965 [Actinobacteria bacterium]|nr:hypothetical protein [Actinomycetota bacterium]